MVGFFRQHGWYRGQFLVDHPAETFLFPRVFVYERGIKMKKIYVSDYSLKKMAEDRKSAFLFREKTALAACIQDFGADAIELDAVKKIKEDTIIYRTIAANIGNCALCIPAGVSEAEIDAAWDCVKDAKNPVLQIMLPVSTVQMEYMYHTKADKMLVKIAALCKYAKTKCSDVEFVALDATRADAGFLAKACLEAVNNGATAITVCDDEGTTLPDEMADIIKEVKGVCQVSIYIKASDAISMATAVALSAIEAGADGVKTAISGKDTLRTHKFAQTVRLRGESLGIYTDLDETKIASDVRNIKKAVYATDAQSVTADGADDIILDANSTLTEVIDAAASLGYDLSIEDNGKVYAALQVVCEKKNSVGTKELEAIIASSAMQAPSTYHLENFVTNCSNTTSSMTQIVLKKDGETLSGVATGDGPVDSAFRAIEQAVGFHYELDDFQIHSVTQGKEALGSAVVRLIEKGKLYSGNGLSADIVGASIRAYINALNKIVYEEM